MASKDEKPVTDMRWLGEGKEDPAQYLMNFTREDLALASFSDDELANAVYMSGDISKEEDLMLSINAQQRGEFRPTKLMLLTAAKDRIRWLTRQLAVAEGRYPGVPRPMTEDDLMAEGLKKVEAQMLETDPSRGLPHFQTVKEAEASIPFSQRSYFDPAEAAYYVEDYLNVADLEALLFAARVRDLAKDFKELGDIDNVPVNQLRQVILPGRTITDIDSSIFSAPIKGSYADGLQPEEGKVANPDPIPFLAELDDNGRVRPSSTWIDWYESTYGTDTGSGYIRGEALINQVFNLQRQRDPVIVGGSRDAGLRTIFEQLQHLPEGVVIPKGLMGELNKGSPQFPDYEGDTLLLKRFQRDLPLSDPRKEMFGSTTLGKLLARSVLPTTAGGWAERGVVLVHNVGGCSKLDQDAPTPPNFDLTVPKLPAGWMYDRSSFNEKVRQVYHRVTTNKGETTVITMTPDQKYLGSDMGGVTTREQPNRSQGETEVYEYGGADAPMMLVIDEDKSWVNDNWVKWYMKLHDVQERSAVLVLMQVLMSVQDMLRGYDLKAGVGDVLLDPVRALVAGLGFVPEHTVGDVQRLVATAFLDIEARNNRGFTDIKPADLQ